jgi:selenide,water dikinase
LNSAGPDLAALAEVHAITDVTGFGLLGHLLGMCRGAGLGARLQLGRVPELAGVRGLLRDGYATGASARNWTSYGHDVRLAPALTPLDQTLLCDPQTSGGLLIACAPETAAAALEIFRRAGFGAAAVIGAMREGAPVVTVEA